MSKTSAAANVIDLEAFRQRKMMRGGRSDEALAQVPATRDAAMLVPVWFCWVPVFSTFVP